MLNILFITTQHRSGERIYPIIPHLAKDYSLDLFKTYHMHPKTGRWGGNIDMRKIFDNEYSKCFDNFYDNIDDIPFDKYNLILSDDCRLQTGMGEVYKRRNCLMLSHCHGNNAFGYPIINYQKCFDGCFVFGQKEISHPHLIPGGVPSNDKLIKYKDVKKEHILVITNFLGNKPTYTDPFGFYFLPFDKHFFDELNIVEIQKEFKKPVIIKIKSREHLDYQESINYVESILPQELEYKIIVDVEDDNLLVAQSEVVIGHPSTMMLKPLQLGIPTAMIKNYGYGGEGSCIFGDCEGLVDLDYDKIMKVLKTPPPSKFILDTVEGGITFNSTEHYTHYIKQCINN